MGVGAGIAVAAVVAAVLFRFNPAQHGFYPICLFHRFTGWNCPGCGSLRAVHQLLHGNVIEALRLNALLVLSVPLGGWLAWRLWRQRRRNENGPVIRPLWIWIYGAAWLVFGIVRELPLPLFAVSP